MKVLVKQNYRTTFKLFFIVKTLSIIAKMEGAAAESHL